MKKTICLVTLAICVGSAVGHWSTPTQTPVSRLIKNIEAYTKEHPKDARGYFLLGRVHGLAFTLQKETIGLWTYKVVEGDKDSLPEIPDRSFQYNWETTFLPIQDTIVHLEKSLRAFEQALKLDDSQATYHLGYAYVVHQASHLVSLLDFVPGKNTLPSLPKAYVEEASEKLEQAMYSADWEWGKEERLIARAWVKEHKEDILQVLIAYRAYPDSEMQTYSMQLLARYWQDIAADHYYIANTLGIKNDKSIKEEPIRGLLSLISYESGKSFELLVKQFEEAEGRIPLARVPQLEQVRKNIAILEAKPKNMAITPIVFSLDHRHSLQEMLAQTQTVMFDLDGDGVVERWPWVKPTTGFLVWDQDRTGKIASGQQLFGSSTWWMFFDDGYAALDALDDNRDGWIRGDERRGLSVWFDHNSNGVSDKGEVQTLADLGVAALTTHATETEDGYPAAPDGMILDDGTVLPTYDWITSPTNTQSEPTRP